VRRRGVTLVDLLLTLSLATILFAGSFRMVVAERHALSVARDNSIALFALEGLRNRIISDIMKRYTFDADRMRIYTNDMKLPYPVELKIIAASPETGDQRRLELRMLVPARQNDPARTYLREVILP